jgi:hypothetical protein
MTDAERNRMQAEIKELQKTVSVSTNVCCFFNSKILIKVIISVSYVHAICLQNYMAIILF